MTPEKIKELTIQAELLKPKIEEAIAANIHIVKGETKSSTEIRFSSWSKEQIPESIRITISVKKPGITGGVIASHNLHHTSHYDISGEMYVKYRTYTGSQRTISGYIRNLELSIENGIKSILIQFQALIEQAKPEFKSKGNLPPPRQFKDSDTDLFKIEKFPNGQLQIAYRHTQIEKVKILNLITLEKDGRISEYIDKPNVEIWYLMQWHMDSLTDNGDKFKGVAYMIYKDGNFYPITSGKNSQITTSVAKFDFDKLDKFEQIIVDKAIESWHASLGESK